MSNYVNSWVDLQWRVCCLNFEDVQNKNRIFTIYLCPMPYGLNNNNKINNHICIFYVTKNDWWTIAIKYWQCFNLINYKCRRKIKTYYLRKGISWNFEQLCNEYVKKSMLIYIPYSMSLVGHIFTYNPTMIYTLTLEVSV